MEHFKADVNSKLVAFIGNPLDHSVAAKAHNALYSYYGINAVYFPFTLEENELSDFIAAAKLLHIPGFGITMPFKNKILKYIDDAEEAAKAFNCVNQVTIGKDGSTYGYSTDGFGMCQAIENTGFKIQGKEVMVLGAGAIGSIIGYELGRRGATKIIFFNRTVEKAESIARKIHELTGSVTECRSFIPEEFSKAAATAGLVVQCTSLGMFGTTKNYQSLDFIDLLVADSLVADAVYNPWRTSILAKAEKRGLTVINGIPMLIEQLTKNLEYNIGFNGMDRKGLEFAEKCMCDALEEYGAIHKG